MQVKRNVPRPQQIERAHQRVNLRDLDRRHISQPVLHLQTDNAGQPRPWPGGGDRDDQAMQPAVSARLCNPKNG